MVSPRLALGASLALGLLAPSRPLVAATGTANFGVNVTVQATCLISNTALAFGAYGGVVTAATATVTITCTDTTPYNVGLDAGTTANATVAARLMAGGGATTLAYGLFQDAAHSVNWGQTVGTDTVPGTGNGAAQALTVYGQIPAGQFVTPGDYSDLITATVTY